MSHTRSFTLALALLLGMAGATHALSPACEIPNPVYEALLAVLPHLPSQLLEAVLLVLETIPATVWGEC